MMTGLNEAMPALDPKAGRRRWVVCGLLFAATAVNYIDRQMIGVLKPTLKEELGWQETDFATIVFWFQMAYAIGYISFGRIVDVLGARLGYAVAIVVWTAGHMAHGFASGVASFAAARFGLGLGERGISRRVSKRWRTGSHSVSAPLPSACSMPGRMWARLSRLCWCLHWCCGSGGVRLFSSRAFSVSRG
jgi:MFS family permease